MGRAKVRVCWGGLAMVMGSTLARLLGWELLAAAEEGATIEMGCVSGNGGRDWDCDGDLYWGSELGFRGRGRRAYLKSLGKKSCSSYEWRESRVPSQTRVRWLSLPIFYIEKRLYSDLGLGPEFQARIGLTGGFRLGPGLG